MKKAFLLHLLMLFIMYILIYPEDVRSETLYFSIDRAKDLAKNNDPELSKLKASLREIIRSKINIYRAFFPKIKVNASGQRIVQQGEADTASYNFGLSLEQILYDQLSTPLNVKSFKNSVEKARLDVAQKEREIDRKVTELYLTIIFGERGLRNSQASIDLYAKMVDLMNIEYKIGSKTLVDVIGADKNLLEEKLKNKELTEKVNIAYRDLAELLNLDDKSLCITVEGSLEDILNSVLNRCDIHSLDSIVEYLNLLDLQSLNESVYLESITKDFGLRKLKVSLRNNTVKRRLLNLMWLKNVSVDCGVDFTGDRFFPVNKTYTLGMTILFDFGIINPRVTVSGSRQPSSNTSNSSGESEILEEIVQVKKRDALNIEAYSLKKDIVNRERKIKRDIDVWFIKLNTLIEKYEIYQKQKEIIDRNEEIVLVKKRIGEVKPIEYLLFMVEKNEFELKMDELSRDFFELAWKFEEISSMKISDFLKNVAVR